ncbi:MAG TPA: histidine ammonia-lyase [Actinomycetota bacterium]|nr:histidine ammonia-lyase [Actinomycetota bacterium]
MTILISGRGLSQEDVVAVARGSETVELDERARSSMQTSANIVASLVSQGTPAYGITTGFGSLASVSIPSERTEELQRSLVRSHAAGMGDPVPREVVRAMVVLRARSLAMGYSGARPEIVDLMLALLNNGVTPVVPEHGSLGASGDLAPLAHCALVLIGEGTATLDDGTVLSGGDALARAGLAPIALRAKEGLALVNGTDGMLGMLVLALHDIAELLFVADVAAAMSVEALLGTDRAFAEDLIALRPQAGQTRSAENLRRMLAGSAIVASHRVGDPRVQDAYSLRCTPQVHGAALDALGFAAGTAERELESAIDNPMVFPDGRVESCGNFHGAPLATALDLLAISIADVGALAERRTDRLLDPARSQGLPAFLAHEPGIDSGLMLAHYAQAAMVADNRRNAVPAGTDTLPTSAMQEDHVSMGWGAAMKLRRSIDNFRRIVAVELLCAARALELRRPLAAARTTGTVRDLVLQHAGGPGRDRVVSPELSAVESLVATGEIGSVARAAL